MKLTTDYREKRAGVLTGQKECYLVCDVEFTHEERALAEQRGMYDQYVSVPASTRLPGWGSNILGLVLRIFGPIMASVGLLFAIGGKMSGTGGGTGFFFFLLGIALFAAGWFTHYRADKREVEPDRKLTLRKLLSNPHFECHAYSLDEAQQFEDNVRGQLQALIAVLRANTAVPEKSTYEL